MANWYLDYFCWDMAKAIAGSEEAITLRLFNSIRERFIKYLDEHFLTLMYQPVSADELKDVQRKLIELMKKEMLKDDKKEIESDKNRG